MKQREWQGKGLGPCKRVSGKNSVTEREWGSREAKMREDQNQRREKSEGSGTRRGQTTRWNRRRTRALGQRGRRPFSAVLDLPLYFSETKV